MCNLHRSFNFCYGLSIGVDRAAQPMAVIELFAFLESCCIFLNKRWCRRAAPTLKSHLARCGFSNRMLKTKTERWFIQRLDKKAIC